MNDLALKTLEPRELRLNTISLRGFYGKKLRKGSGGGSSDGFPQLPGDVTRWHFGGLTNEMMAAMDDPRIEDADGKGRFLSFKNFAWGGMSGVGGYTENYNSNKWYKVESRIDATWTYKSFNARSIKDNRLAQLFYQSSLSDTGFRVLSCTIKVSGLTDGQGIEYVSNGTQQFVIMRIENDGIYHLPSFDFGAKNAYYGFKFLKLQESCNITIEQLPLYPGFILGDGVDDFAVTEKELNFEDTYTVYTAFIPFQSNPTRNMILCGADSKKTFSMQYSSLVYVSFIAGNNYCINADFVNGLNLFACKRNGNNICIKNLLTNKVVTGTCGDWVENAGLYYLWKNATYASFARAAIAGQTICNGYFSTDKDDEKVLDWYKKQYPWLFPDQAWTVTGKTNQDEDRATIANITGNGNDLVLSNFAFSGNSGYGEYAYNFNDTSWISIPDYGVISDKTSKSFNIKSFVLADYPVLYTAVNKDSSIKKVKIKVTNSIPGFYFGNKPANQIIDLSTDGIYEIPSYNSPNDVTQYGFRCSNVNDSCNITIEQIPEYEGYLVTDGVDDEIVSAKLIQFADKFTIVGDWKFMEDRNDNAGLLKSNQIYIYNATTGMRIYLKQGSKNYPFSCKKINALTSDGWVYDEKWDKYKVYPIGSDIDISSRLFLGFYSSNFTKIALKNLGIYNDQLLSKDDCIKAYNYLQTLKAK